MNLAQRLRHRTLDQDCHKFLGIYLKIAEIG
ncbi:hypothetical protein RTM1035_08134 [Roseovarius sp. TM1035]|nr:hypothetical protein RTM1035_08134 [Roseovarius sp. TM1035]